MIPWRIQAHNPNGISIGSAVFAQMTAVSLYFTMGRPFPLKIVYSHGVIWTPSNTWFLGPTLVVKPNGKSIGSAISAQLTAESAYTLQRAVPFPQNCPF